MQTKKLSKKDLSTVVFVLCYAGILVTLVVIMGVLFASSPDPDRSVYNAAKLITSAPTVAKGRADFLKCGYSDVFRYDVSNSFGKHVGYVCQGWGIIPGVQKGATPRF